MRACLLMIVGGVAALPALLAGCGGGGAASPAVTLTCAAPQVPNAGQTACVMPSVSGVAPAAGSLPTYNQPFTLVVSGDNLPDSLKPTLAGCASLALQGGGSASSRSYTCTPQRALVASGQVATVDGTVLKAFEVPIHSTLTASGSTSAQCYAAGSDTLVDCASAGAAALSGAGKQPGMLDLGQPFAYASVGSFAKTECVQDKVTGLMWEGKTADGGLRDGNNRYTHYDDATQPQKWNNATSSYVNPSAADIAAASNSMGYAAAVNAAGLCGHGDWRLPTPDELQSLVNYGSVNPAFDASWFPNTRAYTDGTYGWYWSRLSVAGDPSFAWNVGFDFGYVYGYGDYRGVPAAVRLVRASQ